MWKARYAPTCGIVQRQAKIRSVSIIAAMLLLLGREGIAQVQTSVANDYPTVARADYVLGCMAANGETRPALEHCACSIDVIASLLPYDRYVQAETILSVGQVAGQSAELFRSSAMFRDIVADLRRAQAEAEIECFP